MAGNLQYDANLLPNTTGLDLGSSSQRWDLFGNNLDIVGTISGTTYSCDTTLGFSAAVNAAITALPSTGGIIDATGFTGAQSALTTITISKPVRLLLGGVTVTASVSPLFTVSSQFELKGWGRNTTTLISSSGGAIATFSGTAIKWLHWSNLKLSGGATTSSVFSIADYSGGVFDMSQGMYVFENLWINGFGGDATSLAAMSFGQSTYNTRIIGCTFTDNKVDLKFARYCEAELFSNQFYNLTANSTQLRHLWLVGGSSIFRVCANDFENNGATSATEDIRIDANGDGNWWIVDNKFGSEGDIAARSKIKFTTSGGAQAIGLKIVGNNFLAGAGLANTAISIAGSIESIRVDGNVFYTSGFAKLVDDSFTPISNSGGQGHSSFKDNRIYSLGTGDFTVFSNAGRGFADLQDLTAGTESNSGYIQTMYEPPSLSNRLTFSEAFNSWTANGTAVTTGQTDPFGTTRACLLTKGVSAAGSVLLQFTPVISRMTFSLWAKSGTASKLQVGIYNLTTGNFLEVKTFLLVSSFQRFKFTVGGIDTAVNYRFYIYPDGQDATAKTCTVFGAQAADFDSDYVGTTGVLFSSVSYGGRRERYIQFNKGIVIGDASSLNPSDAAFAASLITSHRSITSAVDFPSCAANSSQDSSGITCVGALSGDTVGVGVPAAVMSAVPNCSFSGYVSASDTVKVRMTNPAGSGSPDPPSGTFRIDVWKH